MTLRFRLTVTIDVNILYLPPANEVWGKVMFSQMSVCPQSLGPGGFVCGSGGVHTSMDTNRPWTHTPDSQQACSTHPTGMPSCL